ncbi:MAG: class I adenylate-forming enzyme family protein [Candidatus Thorarchaeota archaeon]
MRLDYIVKKNARSKQDKVALVDVMAGENFITYGEYNQRCINFANYVINDFKINPDERIALLLENSIEICVAYYSIPKTSAITVPLNFFMAKRELEYCINDCKPVMLIYGNNFADDINYYKENCPSIKEYISEQRFNELCQKSFEGKRLKPPRRLYEEDIAFIAYTGGTTGFPKGVMLTHAGLFNNMMSSGESVIESIHEDSNILKEDALDMLEHTILIPIPIFHLAAMLVFLMSSFVGYTIYLHKGFKADKVVKSIDKYKINHLACVPTNIISLLEFLESDRGGDYDLSSLTALTYGAAPISPKVLSKIMEILPNTKFRQAYGQTEYSPVITQLTSEDHELAKKYPEILKSGGRPQYGTEVIIVDKNGNFLPKGEIGEVIASGKSIMRGYWNKEKLTQKTIRKIFGKNWLFTGDIGYIKEINGKDYLFLTDRAKDMIVSGGENIYPKEIENVIYQFDGVKMCAVIGVPSEKWGEAVVALIVPKKGANLKGEQIIEYCGEHLAGYKKPKKVIFRDDFPVSAQGKILKRVLKDEFWKGKDRHIH